MERTTLDLWVGAFVVAGIAALVVLALKVGNLSTFSPSDTYQLDAYFNNVGGLKPEASIRSAGVLVGRVTGVTLDTKRYEGTVTMRIDKCYKVPKGTFARILTSGLLGEQYIGLSAGGDYKMLKNGDEVKHTQSAMVLENLVSKFLYNKASSGSNSK